MTSTSAPQRLQVRQRSGNSPDDEWRAWDPARAAVVICDMWDAHHCSTGIRADTWEARKP